MLITRYRPRGVKKSAEPWDRWDKRLAPSERLLDAFLGRRREGRRLVATDLTPLSFEAFAARYREEMRSDDAQEALDEYRALAKREPVTFLCYCEDEARCHRSLARSLACGGRG